MKQRKNRLKIAHATLLLILSTAIAHSETISGYVFIDLNKNGVFDKNETPLENVCVSNGTDVVTTNKKGKYTLPLIADASIFVIKPNGYLPRLSKYNIPQNYTFNKPQGSPEYIKNGIEPVKLNKSQNFAFYENGDESSLKICLLGDTQTRYKDELYYLGNLVGGQLVDKEFDFIVPLGDIVDDNQDLLEPVKKVLAKVGAPIYCVMGNHDRNYEAKSLIYRDETYKNIYGPSYYAFNYGGNCFIVLNDIFPDTTGASRKYVGRFDNKQLKFIENYLSYVTPKTPIYLFMHIPLEETENLKDLLSLFQNHPKVTAYAGHTHTQYYKYLTREDGWTHNEPLMELVAGAVCGSWWNGQKDMFGIPNSMMRDGTPKGYWIMNIEGNSKPTFKYNTSDNFSGKQMHIWTPYNFTREKVFYTNKEILANIYAADENTIVEINIENQTNWIPMEKITDQDPYYSRILKLNELGLAPKENIRAYSDYTYQSRHLYKLAIPSGLENGIYTIKIRAKNNMGLNTESGSLLFIEK